MSVMLGNIFRSTVGACSCGCTKTGSVSFHHDDCRYRVLVEAHDHIVELQNKIDLAIVQAELIKKGVGCKVECKQRIAALLELLDE